MFIQFCLYRQVSLELDFLLQKILNQEISTDNNDSISLSIDPTYQCNYSLPRIIHSRYFARVNDRILRITLRSNCPYFSSFSTEDPESFKDAIISYLFTRNSRTTKADRRYRSKLYSYCDPCSQWEQWSVVMPVKFSKDKNRVGQFHRCSKARCFQTLIIRISFHHGGTAVPVSAGHRCFNKARRSNTVEYI